VAIRVQHATFQWEEVNAHANDLWGKGRKQVKKAGKEEKARDQNDTLDGKPEAPTGTKDEQPFSLKGVNLEVPRGRLCAIVGPVGSGKSSLLSGLLGEMKQLAGTVVFGGSVAYCSQIAWIQNASVVSTTCTRKPYLQVAQMAYRGTTSCSVAPLMKNVTGKRAEMPPSSRIWSSFQTEILRKLVSLSPTRL